MNQLARETSVQPSHGAANHCSAVVTYTALWPEMPHRRAPGAARKNWSPVTIFTSG